MIDLTIAVADGATVYVPIPCRCTLAKMVAVLKDKPLQASKGGGQAPAAKQGQSFDDMDDDIPF